MIGQDAYRDDVQLLIKKTESAVTFIYHITRRLQNQTALCNDLHRRHPHISVRLINFAAIPLSEQLCVTRETNMLVGVRGAGLTNSVFMRGRWRCYRYSASWTRARWVSYGVSYARPIYFHVRAASVEKSSRRRGDPCRSCKSGRSGIFKKKGTGKLLLIPS